MTSQTRPEGGADPERNDHAGLRPDAVPAEERIGDDRRSSMAEGHPWRAPTKWVVAKLVGTARPRRGGPGSPPPPPGGTHPGAPPPPPAAGGGGEFRGTPRQRPPGEVRGGDTGVERPDGLALHDGVERRGDGGERIVQVGDGAADQGE